MFEEERGLDPEYAEGTWVCAAKLALESGCKADKADEAELTDETELVGWNHRM